MTLPPALRSGRVWTGLLIVGTLVGAAALAPWIVPNDPSEQNLVATFLPPAWAANGDPAFPLGTDSLGRDIATIMGFLAGQPAAVYADAFDRREDMVSLVARWRPELRLDAA